MLHRLRGWSIRCHDLALSSFLSHFRLLHPRVGQRALGRHRTTILVPVIHQPRPKLLLARHSVRLHGRTKRITFPKNTISSASTSIVTTTLHRTRRRITVPPSTIRIVNILPPISDMANCRMAPIINVVPPSLPCHTDRSRISTIFRVPLTRTLRLNHCRPLSVCHHNSSRQM